MFYCIVLLHCSRSTITITVCFARFPGRTPHQSTPRGVFLVEYMSDKVLISSVFNMHYLIIHVVLYCFIVLFYCIAHAQPLLFLLPVFPAVLRTKVRRAEYFYSTVEYMSDRVLIRSVFVTVYNI